MPPFAWAVDWDIICCHDVGWKDDAEWTLTNVSTTSAMSRISMSVLLSWFSECRLAATVAPSVVKQMGDHGCWRGTSSGSPRLSQLFEFFSVTYHKNEYVRKNHDFL